MGKYDDIIDLPRPVSRRHAPMPMLNRAAQFSPFAALTGYGAAIEEAARLTDRWIDLSESEKLELSEKLGALRPGDAMELTYFIPDLRKDGGRYETQRVILRQVIPSEGRLTLSDGRSIDLDAILDVEKAEAE
ncbi:MAG: hypothetical protein IJ124_02215 [Clostridia bacterium]|nr:hypothetical protein [Clostridia bacterium]